MKKMQARHRFSKGFTLIELSIVLVIIGLIIGGVLMGRDLIKAAEIRGLTSQLETYQTATNTFRLKYNALPGDIVNATDYWAASGACPRTDSVSTCNGDGDSTIEFNYGASVEERYWFWNHLSLATLINGMYYGQHIGNSSIIGAEVPETPFGGSGFLVTYYSDIYDHAGYMMEIGSYGNGGTSGPFISPQDAWAVDIKMDDGQNDDGRLLATGGYDEATASWTTTCADQQWTFNGDANYLLEEVVKGCRMFLMLGF